MYDSYAIEGTHLTVDAAFLRHITSKVEARRKRLSCIAEKRGLYCNIQYKQTHTGTRRAAFIRTRRICSLHMCNAQSIMHFIRNP